MIEKAMILAAGLGTRMRPLTNDTPKPLIKVNGKALIDYKLDAAKQAGIKTVVVNVHYLADQLEDHLHQVNGLEIIISDEREELLDSGGGIANALNHFGDQPFAILNSDTFWHADQPPSLVQLMEHWNKENMDILMALAKTEEAVGFGGAGDFFKDQNHLLTRRGKQLSAPFAFSGDYIVHPKIFQNAPDGRFSANSLFDTAIAAQRLYGLKMNGLWLHVGTQQSISEAQSAIALHSA